MNSPDNGSGNNCGSGRDKGCKRRGNLRGKWWPVGAALLLAAGGCQNEALNQMLNVPTPQPTPTPAPTPKPDFFDPNDYVGFVATDGTTKIEGVKLPPGQHRVTGVTSAEIVTVQGVQVDKDGKPALDKKGQPRLGTTAERVHVAGIISPAPGRPGWQSAVRAVLNWTVLNPKNKTVEVQVDPRFPYDLAGRRMVQIYFNGTTEKTAGTRFSLNRMLVRSGWAVVDLHTATAIDLQAWLNDERYARNKRLGLWGLGIILQQRDPLPLPKGARRETGRSSVRIESSRPGEAASTSTTTSSRASSAAVRATTPGGATSRTTTATAVRRTTTTPRGTTQTARSQTTTTTRTTQPAPAGAAR